jgi:hypothetical protein
MVPNTTSLTVSNQRRRYGPHEYGVGAPESLLAVSLSFSPKLGRIFPERKETLAALPEK